MTYARCRSCESIGLRSDVAVRVDLQASEGGVFDKCRGCGSVDVDVMSPEGLRHEELTGELPS